MARAKKQPKVNESVEPPRLGAMSNLFRGKPEEVAGIFADYGLESTQILPSFPGMRLGTADDVTTAACTAIGEPFRGAELLIAGVTAHTNFIDPDRERRKRMVKRFDALVEHCQDFGTRYVITDTGTLNPDHPWEDYAENHVPAALDAFVDAIGPSVQLAEKVDVTILLEGYSYQVLDNVERARQLRERLGEHVGFVIDPPNYFNRKMASAPKRYLREVLEVLGPMGPVAHAKDVRSSGGDVLTSRAGTGNLDYKEYLELLDKYQPGCPLILEQIRPEELRETVEFIDRFFG